MPKSSREGAQVDENELKTLLAKLFDSIVTDLTSHKLAIERLSENQTAQHKGAGDIR
jgi:hypothetical protein